MKRLHIANIDFEAELSLTDSSGSLEKAWERQPLSLLLQYLPLLYAQPAEFVAVTAYPDIGFLQQLAAQSWRQGEPLPALVLLTDRQPLSGYECISWGYSKRVLGWTQERQIAYIMPSDWSLIQRVNSKAYSFQYTPLDQAALLWNISELQKWMHSFEGKKVVKSCFGLSGKGNRIVETLSLDLISFCQKEWSQGRPVVAEPWLNRLFDFSTQWIITSESTIELIGSTVFETNSHGVYQGTLVGAEALLFGEYLPFLAQHQQSVRKALQKMAREGYFGHVGVDALLYYEGGEVKLYPIVEINARKTMSWVMLELQRRWFKGQMIRFQFSSQRGSDSFSLLPEKVGGYKPFKHRLTFASI